MLHGAGGQAEGKRGASGGRGNWGGEDRKGKVKVGVSYLTVTVVVIVILVVVVVVVEE